MLSVRNYGSRRLTAFHSQRSYARRTAASWGIARWDSSLVRPEDPISPVRGWVEAPEYGRFKTKTEALAALAKISPETN